MSAEDLADKMERSPDPYAELLLELREVLEKMLDLYITGEPDYYAHKEANKVLAKADALLKEEK